MVLLVPVIEGFTESVAVTVNVPDFFGETLNVPVPLVSVTGFPPE